MMNAETNNQKQIYLKTYLHLSLLEDALKSIKKQDQTAIQISILGKIDQFYRDKNIVVRKDTDTIKRFWEKTLNNIVSFGSLNNPEIGHVFIVGALTSTFLNKMNGRPLGMLSVGPYGILRGIGANETQASECLTLLKNGSYILILRGFKDELESFRKILEERENV